MGLYGRKLIPKGKTAKVPNVCIPQLPVRILRRNACYSRARGRGGGIWRRAGGRGNERSGATFPTKLNKRRHFLMICFIHRFPNILLGVGEYHTFQGDGRGIDPLLFFVFRLFLFVASKILTGNLGIPHFELWARLGSSFSSFYFSFSSSSSPFPSTRPPYLPLLIHPLPHLFPVCFFPAVISPSVSFFCCLFLFYCLSANSQFPLGPRPIRVSG